MPEAMFNLKFLNTMANYSFNQVRHLYIADAYSAVAGISEASNPKVIGAKGINDGGKKQFYLLYKGAKTVMKSDLIDVNNIDSIRIIKGADQAIKMKKYEVIVTDAPVTGQDYILGINFRNFFSSGDASQYYKNAAVHVTSAINSKSAFYKAMVKALNKAFAREDGATPTSNPYLRFAIKYSDGIYEESNASFDGATATAIVIEEKAQEWELGTKKARRIMFDVIPGFIYTGGEDVVWGTAEVVASNAANNVKNGQQIADLEWACMGERGDQYRNVGWPNVIKTEYLADATKQYSLIEIHYAFTDTGVNSYRTEKELTIAVPDGSAGHVYDAINDIIDGIEEATGLTIAGLSE